MLSKDFLEAAQKVPHLIAQGFVGAFTPTLVQKRQEFLEQPLYLEEARLAAQYLRTIGKSTRFSSWQRQHCTPENLRLLLEEQQSRSFHLGSLVIAALVEGFTMGVQSVGQVYFNFMPRQIEVELLAYRRKQIVRKVMGA